MSAAPPSLSRRSVSTRSSASPASVSVALSAHVAMSVVSVLACETVDTSSLATVVVLTTRRRTTSMRRTPSFVATTALILVPRLVQPTMVRLSSRLPPRLCWTATSTPSTPKFVSLLRDLAILVRSPTLRLRGSKPLAFVLSTLTL